MKNIGVMLAMVLAIGMIATGMAAAQEKNTEECPVIVTVVVIGDSNMKVPEAIAAFPGDYFKVVLYAAGGTGYNWILDSDSLTSIEMVTNSTSPVSSLPLAGGKARWEFYLRVKPETKGQETLHFHLSRSWEKNEKSDQVVDLTVITK